MDRYPRQDRKLPASPPELPLPRRISLEIRWALTWIALLLPAIPAQGGQGLSQGSGIGGLASTAPQARVSVPPLDVNELEAFLDGLMAAHLLDHQVAGATVAIVRDGSLLFSKGYGFADADGRVPVDPATTLFRIGSVTKTFTWTAVLQLRDAGFLDLDRDVNEYLDFRIPDTFAEPITLRHLLTHTPGFEDRVFGMFGEDSGLPRGEWLRRNLPARVRPPGVLPAYSNYGAGLAGYIVERVSGMAWESYVDTRILEPLGMTYATPWEPLPAHLAPHMSGGFAHIRGRFIPKPFERIGAMAPAGSISASAEAMAAYMISHLGGGLADNGLLLAEGSAREMRDRAFSLDPRVNGLGLGFYEMSSHGVRIVGHGGGTQWFFTDMALFPDDGLGIFVSYNSAGGAILPIDRFMRAFLAHFVPAERPTTDGPLEGWEHRASEYEGRYQMLRRPYSNFEKLLGLMMQWSVRAGADGEITVSSSIIPGLQMVEIEPGYFRSVDGYRDAAFVRDARTGRSLFLFGALPPVPAEKIGIADSPGLHLAILLFWGLAFASMIILLPARYLLQRMRSGLPPLRGAERGLRWAAFATALCGIAFPVGFAAIGDTESFLSGSPAGIIRVALLFPVLALPLSLLLLAGSWVAYRRGYWGRWGRAHFAAVALASLTFLAQLHYWNLLGWRF